MRGRDFMQDTLFTTRSLESFVPANHPLRPIREILNTALKRMDSLFEVMYAEAGRDSIAPEKLLRALMLQVLYGMRSERMLVEQLGYNLLFRWFVGLATHDAGVEPRGVFTARVAPASEGPEVKDLGAKLL